MRERGENLDSLQDKTENLSVSAQGFRRGANRVRKNMWWKDMSTSQRCVRAYTRRDANRAHHRPDHHHTTYRQCVELQRTPLNARSPHRRQEEQLGQRARLGRRVGRSAYRTISTSYWLLIFILYLCDRSRSSSPMSAPLALPPSWSDRLRCSPFASSLRLLYVIPIRAPPSRAALQDQITPWPTRICLTLWHCCLFHSLLCMSYSPSGSRRASQSGKAQQV